MEKIEYYECIDGGDNFILGNVYKIVNSDNLEAPRNFIGETGVKDGWSGLNYKHFKPYIKNKFNNKPEDYSYLIDIFNKLDIK